MAVTKKIGTLALLAFMILGYQNCMMDMASTTPGAASISCSPTGTALTEFQVIESTILQPTGTISAGKVGCGSCHAQSATNPGKSVFMILGTAGSNDTATSMKNYCAMELKGATRMMHPRDASHSGGVYTTLEIPSYYNFINKYW